MALSNWDTLAIDHNSDPMNGVIRSELGVEVEIYKNWLYIRDKVAWQEGGGYIEPTVMEIQSGNLIYKDVNVYAERGPQNGIYCIVCTPVWINEEKGKKPNAMIGIGCSGYDGDEWVGVRSESVDFLAGMIKLNIDDLPWSYEKILGNLNFKGALRFNQGDEYFANKLNSGVPTSKIGEAEEPIIMKALKGEK